VQRPRQQALRQMGFDCHISLNGAEERRTESEMDDSQARILLSAERARVEELLSDLRRNRRADRSAVGEQGDMSDPAESFVTEGTDDAIALGMTRRLEAIERAEMRLAAGTYGHSVESGELIPDERLEADPAAELTVEEALGLT
jgi:DnaK suppressor protein